MSHEESCVRYCIRNWHMSHDQAFARDFIRKFNQNVQEICRHFRSIIWPMGRVRESQRNQSKISGKMTNQSKRSKRNFWKKKLLEGNGGSITLRYIREEESLPTSLLLEAHPNPHYRQRLFSTEESRQNNTDIRQYMTKPYKKQGTRNKKRTLENIENNIERLKFSQC